VRPWADNEEEQDLGDAVDFEDGYEETDGKGSRQVTMAKQFRGTLPQATPLSTEQHLRLSTKKYV
jgi:hypothetical protein